uniref:Uncharacterized protein n=1 Tax=Cacopsylla melanoneura TaxID=428564 RepID=A0A8D8PX97_9HEMI
MFTTKHADYNVSAQRLTDQIRVIHRNNLISEIRRNLIKEEIALELEGQQHEHDDNENRNNDTTEQDNTYNTNNSETPDVNTDQDIQGTDSQATNQGNTLNEADSRTKEVFLDILSLYDKTDPTKRPPIPKANPFRKVSSIIEDLNDNILPPLLDNIKTMEDLQTVVYCAAITVAIRIGKNVNINPNNERTTTRPFATVRKSSTGTSDHQPESRVKLTTSLLLNR